MRNVQKHEEKSRHVYKWGRKPFYRPNETFVFVFHTCFYVLLAIGSGRGPAGRGVGGKVNLPPPIGGLRDVPTEGRRIFRWFGDVFLCFWDGFGMVLGCFWDGFGVDPGSFGKCLGMLWACFAHVLAWF